MRKSYFGSRFQFPWSAGSITLGLRYSQASWPKSAVEVSYSAHGVQEAEEERGRGQRGQYIIPKVTPQRPVSSSLELLLSIIVLSNYQSIKWIWLIRSQVSYSNHFISEYSCINTLGPLHIQTTTPSILLPVSGWSLFIKWTFVWVTYIWVWILALLFNRNMTWDKLIFLIFTFYLWVFGRLWIKFLAPF